VQQLTWATKQAIGVIGSILAGESIFKKLLRQASPSQNFSQQCLLSLCRAKKVLSSLNIFSLTFLQSLQITSNHSFYYPPILRKTVKAVTKTTSDKVTKIKNIDGNSDLKQVMKMSDRILFQKLWQENKLNANSPKVNFWQCVQWKPSLRPPCHTATSSLRPNKNKQCPKQKLGQSLSYLKNHFNTATPLIWPVADWINRVSLTVINQQQNCDVNLT